jgi:FKBP-type peptidyl-prolyl cis-trans isomerase FklB
MKISQSGSLRFALAALFFCSVSVSSAQITVSLDSQENQISYSIGVNIAQNLVGQGLMEDIDVDVFIAGLRDFVGGDTRMDEEQMMAALMAFQQQMTDRQVAETEAARAVSEAFLAENAQKSGVTVTDSGLQYMVLSSGPDDAPKPGLEDSVLAHYHGTLTNGAVFDSSVDRGEPAQFGLTQVIPGWTEALQLMKKGDKWRLFIPADLAYGPTGSGPIPPHSALIFDVELLEINPN